MTIDKKIFNKIFFLTIFFLENTEEDTHKHARYSYESTIYLVLIQFKINETKNNKIKHKCFHFYSRNPARSNNRSVLNNRERIKRFKVESK